MARRTAIVLGVLTVMTTLAGLRNVLDAQAPPPPPGVPQSQAQAQPQPVTGTALILGRVIDATTERPIAGSIVNLTPATPGRPPVPSSITDKDGRFVFRNLPAGRYNLGAAYPAYNFAGFGARRPGGFAQPFELGEAERRSDLVVRLWRGGVITGTVRDEAREPLAGVTVSIWMRTITQGVHRYFPSIPRVTDDRGMYRIPQLPPGDYVVAVTTPRIIARDAGRAHVLGGGREGTPPGASFRVGELSFPLPQPMIPPAAPDGSLRVYRTTFAPASVTLEDATVISVSAGEERGADITLSPVPARRISGRLVSASESVQGVRLRLVPGTPAQVPDALFDTAITEAGADGSFTFLGVPAGQYTIHARITPPVPAPAGGPPGAPRPPVGIAFWASVPVQVAGEDVAGVAVPLAEGRRVTGRVVFDGTRAKPASADVERMMLAFSAGRFNEPFAGAARPDAVGAFTSDPLLPDQYVVQVAGPAPAGWTLQDAIAGDRDVSDLALTVGSGDVPEVIVTFTDTPNALSGNVRSASGAIDTAAVVLVFPTERERWVERGARSMRALRVGPNGSYSTSGIPKGNYFVVAIDDGLAARWPQPEWLQSVAGLATIVTISPREPRVVDLRTAVMP